MLKRIIEDEIIYEKMLLADAEEKIDPSCDPILTYSNGRFHCRDRSEGTKFRYIRKTELNALRGITSNRYRIEKAKILRENIAILEKLLSKVTDYDDEGVISRMPKAHGAAISFLRESSASNGVIQSENPKYRNGLVITASDGLKVRTKGELNLYETLKSYDLNVRYEKKLILKEKTLLSNGDVQVKDVEVYPDFTIIFSDGFKFYWELNGLYDDPGYRGQQSYKINLFYDNDIYMPKNLIITMESANKPLDLMVIRRIIEALLLPHKR